ncbi:MAG: aldehyde dehydrogenase family protein [Acidimicrobiales bacterium]
MFVDGDWTDSESGERFEATSPSSGDTIGSLPKGSRADAGRAIAAANRAWEQWGRRSAFERSGAMRRVAESLERHREELAHVLALDQGKPVRAEALDEVEELIVYFHMASEDTVRLDGALPPSVDANKRVLLSRVPRGVVGVISPWNWPYTMPAEILAPALAAGNAVVWNPASSTSVCAVALMEAIAEADLPPGVLNLVTGPGRVVGDEIAGSSGTHAIGFIGSIGAGLAIAQRAAGKELLLEMGGNGPLVVLDDADLDAAVKATLTACFLNAGQSCTAGELILVQRAVHDAYLERLKIAVEKEIRLGEPFDETTTMGPLNNADVAEKTESHLAEAKSRGANVVSGGERAAGLGSDLYFAPTVVDGVTEEMAIAREETFGPVAPVSVIGDETDAVRIVNSSEYGLLTGVFTNDLARGLRYAEAVRCGWVNINEGTNYWESHLPFGGRSGSKSGVGRVGGRYSMERLTEWKTVVVNLGDD